MNDLSATIVPGATFSAAQDFASRVREFIVSRRLLEDGPPVLLGVSGGVDSMTLLFTLQFIGYRVRVVHVNYGLRDEESDADAALVRSYCEMEGVTFTEIDASGEMRERSSGSSIQAHARQVRYSHFSSIAEDEGIRSVAVAHHMDDQAETLLINMERKTGLDGMVGMRPSRTLTAGSSVRLVRPFLCLRRTEIERFAFQNRIQWRDDATNSSLDFLRGRIRHETLPALIEDVKIDFVPDLVAFSGQMAEFVDTVLPGLLPSELQLDRLSDPGRGGHLPLDLLVDLPDSVRNWLMLRAVRKWIPEAPARKSTLVALDELITSQVGKRIEYTTGSIWRERNALKFVPDSRDRSVNVLGADDRVGGDRGAGDKRADDKGAGDKRADDRGVRDQGAGDRLVGEGEESGVIPLEIDGRAETPMGAVAAARLHARVTNSQTTPDVILVDEDKLSGPLSIRAWKAGDRFCPFGMSGSKKVKSFLTDQKVPPSKRSSVLVLCEGENIVWVLGYRMDDRYRVDDSTRRTIRIWLKEQSDTSFD